MISLKLNDFSELKDKWDWEYANSGETNYTSIGFRAYIETHNPEIKTKRTDSGIQLIFNDPKDATMFLLRWS